MPPTYSGTGAGFGYLGGMPTGGNSGPYKILNGDAGTVGTSAYGPGWDPLGAHSLQDVLAGRQMNLAEGNSAFQHGMENRKFGLLSGMLSGNGLYGNSSYSSLGGGAPQVGVGPIWGEGQIQQQVNASRAGNDASTQNRIQGMEKGMAGRGFAAGSPLQQALTAQYQGQDLASNTANERETRWGAAQGNAEQILRGQQANAQLAMANRQMQMSHQNALISALAGL